MFTQGKLAGCVVLSLGLPLCDTANLRLLLWQLGLIILSGLLGGMNKIKHLKLSLQRTKPCTGPGCADPIPRGPDE